VRIVDLIGVPVRSGFFRDDQASIRAGADQDGFLYVGAPATPGFRTVREAGQAVSLMLVLEDGRVAVGDCAEVQYAGVGGRSALLDPAQLLDEVERVLRPALTGREIVGFRGLAEQVDVLTGDGSPMTLPLRYGISQALLDAAAQARGVTMAEIVRDEYATGVELAPVPLYAQSGDDRYVNVDKMILKRVDVLPHGLINTVDGKLGRRGELLLDYVGWVRDRILQLGADGYTPVLHIDVYGTVGLIFDGDLDAVATYLARLGEQARPFRFRIEHPVDAGDRAGQIATFVALREMLAARGSAVELVADEWCNTLDDIRAFVAARAVDMIQVKTPDLGGVGNTIEALLEVRSAGIGAFSGGTCNETEVSARVCAQIAMACGADQVLAKPGMGVDEGLMLVSNEMTRAAALARSRTPAGVAPGSARRNA
jgi:methylaspartate ammonia-lyase